MKNQILDEPIHDSFSDFLDKGETILWEGQPDLKKVRMALPLSKALSFISFTT